VNYDIIIVGAGPVGLVCGRKCAELGLKTLIVDRKQEIGVPKRCGEGLSAGWIKLSGIKEDSSWCLQKITGAVVYSPTGKEFDIPVDTYGYILERKIFEKKLAENAIEKGCKIMLKSNVTGLLKNNEQITGIKVQTPEKVEEINSKIVIAADGIDSLVARYVGINTVNPLSEVDSGYQYEMANLNFKKADRIHLYFGKEIAPRGYVWIFPKSQTVANVGIGIKGDCEKTAKFYLDKFIETHPEIFEKASVMEINGGCIPVGKFIDKPWAPGLLIIGDAAHMVNPIHGGGIGTGMESALIAAEHVKKAVDENNLTDLTHYFEDWMEKRGKEHLKVLRVRKFFEQLSDKDLEELTEILNPELLLDISGGKKFEALIKVLAKKPNLLLIATKSLLS